MNVVWGVCRIILLYFLQGIVDIKEYSLVLIQFLNRHSGYYKIMIGWYKGLIDKILSTRYDLAL